MRQSIRSFLPHILLLLFLLLAYQLRLHHLDTFSFWTDEGLTPLRSGYSIPEILSNHIIIQEGITNDTHPAFYYLIIHFSQKLFGQTDFAYRYPSLLTSVLLIPLMFQVGRRLNSKALGLLAAFLMGINPLQIWYAHEARMYTLLVLLAAGATFILWRAMHSNGRSLLTFFLIYILLAGLALYTHYTAVFLIAAQGIFWLWLFWHNGQKKLIIAGGIILALASIPLIPYTIPRLFTGAEASYFYVPPWIMLQDVVHGFGLGVSADSRWWGTQLLNIANAMLLFVGIYAAGTRLKRTFLLSYLLAAVFGLMLGSLLLKPMYQGIRHIMVGSPAFILLIAWAVIWLWQRFGRVRLTAVLPLIATIILLTGSIISLNNIYNNPRFVKDNFRQMIQTIEQQAGANDVVLYNNAILLPLHNHYQTRANLPVTASPIYPHASQGSPAQLAQLAQQYDRIWFVTDPPADKRDEDKIVRTWLDTHLTLANSYLFPARTTEVRVILYDTRPFHTPIPPTTSQPINQQWPDFPTLQSFALPTPQRPALWLDLYWQANGFIPADQAIQFSLRGIDDKDWLTERPSLLPQTELAQIVWPSDGLVHINYNLPLPAGLPPGTYRLTVQPFTAVNGHPLADATPLTEVVITTTSTPPPTPPAITFANGLALQSFITPDNEVRPGHALPFTLYWQTEAKINVANFQYQLEVIAPDGEVLSVRSGQPGASWLDSWPAHSLINQNSALYFPPTVRPGKYQLRWQLLDEDMVLNGRRAWQFWAQKSIHYGEIEVIPWPLITELPTNTTVMQANFGDDIQLYSYQLTQLDPTLLDLTLYWQALTSPSQDYLTFIHLVSADSEEIVAQTGFIPADGLRPTQGWRSQEVITDHYTLAIPPDVPSGSYYVRVGLYTADEVGERPSVIYRDQPQPNNQLTLTTLTLP